jgi:hypothetical protein
MKFTRFADQQAATIFSSILLYDVGEEVIVWSGTGEDTVAGFRGTADGTFRFSTKPRRADLLSPHSVTHPGPTAHSLFPEDWNQHEELNLRLPYMHSYYSGVVTRSNSTMFSTPQ